MLRHPVHAWLIALMLVIGAGAPPAAAETHPAHDTLGQLTDGAPAAERLLRQVGWEAAAFVVTVRRIEPRVDADAVVSFASPLPSGNHRQDTVPLLWYTARDAAGQPVDAAAPAVLVIHTVHPQLLVGKTIARALAREGMHAFVLQLPGFGDRATPGSPGPVVLLDHARQAVADVRRARDAIAALPGVADGPVALQATSLGGFVATVAASLDDAFNPVLLALTGGNGFDVLQHGQRDAAHVRLLLNRHGYHDARLRDHLAVIEPLHVAHRLAPARTWLFTGQRDQVIAPAHADALAEAAGLDAAHHIRFDADHYTAVFHLPTIIRQMAEIVRTTHGNVEKAGAEGR
ncbi:MAG: hypothetical protein WD534_00910 [Phycisphaeraceae bacterium]